MSTAAGRRRATGRAEEDTDSLFRPARERRLEEQERTRSPKEELSSYSPKKFGSLGIFRRYPRADELAV